MKLWQKLFLCALSLIMAAVGVSSIFFLKSNVDMTMEQTVENGFSNYDYWVANVKSLLLEKRLKENTLALPKERVLELLKEQFQAVELDGTAVYLFGEDGSLLYQRGGSDRKDAFSELLEKLSEEDGRFFQIGSRDGKACLEMASKIRLEAETYLFVMEQDIQSVFLLYERQLETIRVVSLACGAGLAFLLLIVMRVLLRPLRVLNQETRAIAQGDYGRQIAIQGSGELKELSDNMNQMSAAVSEKVRMLSDVAENRKRFIANLSHEMKTPLTSISGFAQLLKIQKVDEKRVAEYASIISEESGRLKSLSGKLLEWVTLGEVEPDWEEIDFKEFLEELSFVLMPIAQNRQIFIEIFGESYRRKGDRELLKSLFYNLADNAMKASSPGGRVVIEGKRKDGGFAVSVSDQGIGISKEELRNITEPFYMVDRARSRREGGAGLGLSLCVEIARVHGAELLLESVLNQGTTAIVLWKEGEYEG